MRPRDLVVGLLLAACLAAPAFTRPSRYNWARAVLPGGVEIKLEMAVTAEQRMDGYMFREHVADDEGMLFLFDTITTHGIWMRNCKVPLDILWLDEKLRIVHVAENLQPCPPADEDPDGEDCPVHSSLRKSAYVLELAAGRVEALGLEAGQTVVVLSDPELRR